jgi:hypothetical protein
MPSGYPRIVLPEAPAGVASVRDPFDGAALPVTILKGVQ